MDSTQRRPAAGTMGGIQVWVIILILAVICIGALLYFQIQEHRYYEQEPSAWPKAEVTTPAAPILEPLAEGEHGIDGIEPSPDESSLEEKNLEQEPAVEEDSSAEQGMDNIIDEDLESSVAEE